MLKTVALAGLMAVVGVPELAPTAAVQPNSTAQPAIACRVTQPNGNGPAHEAASPTFHGSGTLVTQLWPDGTIVFAPNGPGFVLEDGALSMKFPWWRGERGSFRIEGRRIDGDAPPLRSHIPSGYGDSGFQATALIFPTAGCWEVTGYLGTGSLTFVTRVVKL